MTMPCFVEEQYYAPSRYNSMPNFAANAHTKKNVNRVYYRNTGGVWPGWARGDDFAGRWTTKWRVDKGGKYKFRLGSDDGSRMYLNNKYYLNNDGLHGFRVREVGWGTIKAGQLYSIRVEFFDVVVMLASDSTSWVQIPRISGQALGTMGPCNAQRVHQQASLLPRALAWEWTKGLS